MRSNGAVHRLVDSKDYGDDGIISRRHRRWCQPQLDDDVADKSASWLSVRWRPVPAIRRNLSRSNGISMDISAVWRLSDESGRDAGVHRRAAYHIPQRSRQTGDDVCVILSPVNSISMILSISRLEYHFFWHFPNWHSRHAREGAHIRVILAALLHVSIN